MLHNPEDMAFFFSFQSQTKFQQLVNHIDVEIDVDNLLSISEMKHC